MIEQSLRQPGHTLFLRGYKDDAEGNLLGVNDSHKGLRRFTYDSVERLLDVSQPETGYERFNYDSTGNLLRRGSKEFRYSVPDRLSETSDATLIYDEVGNLIEKRRSNKAIHYSYNSDNQLILVESEHTGRIEFRYDAFGRRISKITKDGQTGFLWDGDVLLMEQQDEKFYEYIFDLDSYEPLCRLGESGFETYHNDHLGTPHELTDKDARLHGRPAMMYMVRLVRLPRRRLKMRYAFNSRTV